MSKGLEALKELMNNVIRNDDKLCNKKVTIIEKELEEKEKQDDYIKSLEDRIDNLETSYLRIKKALEIIKENNMIRIDEWFGFTQEEYDLLKEVLL